MKISTKSKHATFMEHFRSGKKKRRVYCIGILPHVIIVFNTLSTYMYIIFLFDEQHAKHFRNNQPPFLFKSSEYTNEYIGILQQRTINLPQKSQLRLPQT
jgi:hypothetical protein